MAADKDGRVRLLILSDIHSNLDALETCLAVAPQHDAVANLGDVVGYGANPNEVVERVRGLGKIFVRGNHDRVCSGIGEISDFNPMAGAAALWTRKTLTQENRAWVAGLPMGPITGAEWPDTQFVHGSPLGEDDYILTEPVAEIALDASPFSNTFFGHTHMQGMIVMENCRAVMLRSEMKNRTQMEEETVTLPRGTKCLANPGSIGQPRDGDPRAGFAIYDSDENAFTFYRVPYDVTMAQQRILRVGLPERLAYRLSEGR